VVVAFEPLARTGSCSMRAVLLAIWGCFLV